MGKQINYYMDYESFLQVAQLALECGCIIIKEDLKSRPTKVIQSRDISVVTRDCWDYYFYLPEAGELIINTYEIGERLDHGTGKGGNALIEAGFMIIREDTKEIRSNRMYAATGYYEEDGTWIPRSDCLTKVYNKLVRLVKKLAPYTEITDTITRTDREHHLEKKKWSHKEYVTDYCLRLRNEQGYKLV